MQKDEPVGKAGKAEQRDLTGAKEGEILTCGRRARPLRSTTVISWGSVGRNQGVKAQLELNLATAVKDNKKYY